MTREKIKQKIQDIVEKFGATDDDGTYMDEVSISHKIMKLWDQGFTYELDRRVE